METVEYYIICVGVSLGVAFVVNVVLVALGAPKWSRPLGWAAWFGDRCVDIGGWFGKQFGRLYVWGAQVLTDCLEHVVPALRQSTKELLSFLFSPFATLAEFFGQLWTTLCNSPYVGALGGFFVSPVVVFLLSLSAFALALYAAHCYYPQYWAAFASYFTPYVLSFIPTALVLSVAVWIPCYCGGSRTVADDPAVPATPVRSWF